MDHVAHRFSILALSCCLGLVACLNSGAEPLVPPGSVRTKSPLPGVIPEERPSGPRYPEWWGSPPKLEQPIDIKDAGSCVQCHKDQGRMDPVHALPCVRCHKGNPDAPEQEPAHKGLIADPGALAHVAETCEKCHPEETERVLSSNMSLAPRMVNHTRFAFGGQASSNPIYGTADFKNLKTLPLPSQSSNVGDDLLRRSCLRCHLRVKGSTRWGEHRGLGCSACHVPYPNNENGEHHHQIMRNIGMTACLKCHNSNHVGADFVGLFEKDYDRGFRSPVVSGKQPPRIYGAEQHFLTPDVHFKAGMICTDCHTLDEIHGSGDLPSSPENGVRISCESCHVTGDHPAVLKDTTGTMTLLRGKARRIPPWNPALTAHQVKNHVSRLKCSSCHAAWSFQDYGLHLMLEERADYWKWSTTAAQNDPQIQDLLERNVGTEAELIQPMTGPVPSKPEEAWEPPTTLDWLNGEKRPGAWFRGFTLRTWSRPPLGLDSKGKISIMRPIFQYVVSHVDKDCRLRMDRVVPTTGAGFPALIFNPYSPHTISKTGRACHECHGNPKAVGMGESLIDMDKRGIKPLWSVEKQIPNLEFRWDDLVDEKGAPVQRSSHPFAGPLDQPTISKLLNPSNYFKAMWHRYLSGKSAPKEQSSRPGGRSEN